MRKANTLTQLDILRKVIHILFGSALLVLLSQHLITHLSLFFLLLGIFAASLILRFAAPSLHRRIVWLTEKSPQSAAGERVMLFLVGVILALRLFPEDIAYSSIAILTFGDGISGLIGPFGRLTSPLSSSKLLEGTFAGIAAGASCALLFVSPIEAFLAATVAMTAEAVEWKLNNSILDDNLIVPLTAGVALTLYHAFEISSFFT